MTQTKRQLFALILPILVLLGWWGKLEYQKQNGQILRLAVEGYDPRDLLAGHYLTFQLKLGDLTCQKKRRYAVAEEICLCIDPRPLPELSSPTWLGSCSDRPQACNTFLRGNCSYDRFLSPLNRYYIPERFSSVTWTAPENSSIEIALTAEGNAALRKFFVNEETLEEHAEKLLQKQGRE